MEEGSMRNGGMRAEPDLKLSFVPAAHTSVAELDRVSPQVRTESRNMNARLNGNVRITPEARRYALWELARRAGVPAAFFRSWRVTWADQSMVVEIPNGVLKKISFPYTPTHVLNDLAAGKLSYGCAAWMSG